MPEQKILHMDARELAEVIDVTLPFGKPISCIVTDPPYGVDFRSGFAATTRGKRFTEAIANDEDLEGAIDLFMAVMPPLVELMPDDADLYVFTSWHYEPTWRDVVNELPGVEVKNVLIWQKGWPGLGDLDANWAYSYEMILYAKKGRRKIANRRDSVIAVDRIRSGQNFHPMEKPVELLRILIEQSTNPGDLVVDPFAGSGATLVAAQQLGRSAIGAEVKGEYVDHIRNRLSQVLLDFG